MTGRVIRAGAAYFGLVFAAGFILGTLRVLVVLPLTGELAAVLMELPVMLGLSWLAAGWVLARMPLWRGGRAAMGAWAFALLMLAEAALSVLVFGRSLAEHAALWVGAPGALGLAGQIGRASCRERV